MSNIQFKLEQEIMDCWNITSELDTLFEHIVEGEPTKDEIGNIVLGLQQLYEVKFNKLFRTFEAFLKEYYAAQRGLNKTDSTESD